MKLAWKKNKKRLRSLPSISQLPFDHQQQHPADEESTDSGGHNKSTNDAESFEAQGNKLAEVGKYHEALGKWEAAITLNPERATLHEQKAQVLLEIGETWKSLKAATRATQLEPSWAEAWVTLGRAQLNFGEPDSAIESFDKAIAIKADCVDAKEDRQIALNLVKKRKQLHTAGLSVSENRYAVGDRNEP
ncbi:hypothetical protein R6Q59_025420 [Mikania micrantha]